MRGGSLRQAEKPDEAIPSLRSAHVVAGDCFTQIPASVRNDVYLFKILLSRNNPHLLHQKSGIHFLCEAGFQFIVERELIVFNIRFKAKVLNL